VFKTVGIHILKKVRNKTIQKMNFFHNLDEPTGFKIFSVIFSLINFIVTLPLLTGIIWFEKFGSDKKRTLINMLVSSICWTAIQYGFLVFSLDIMRYLLGKLPQPLCFIQAVLRSSVSSDFILFYDAIIFVRFIYIFVLKNPAALCDEFWSKFLNISIKSCSLLFQSVWHLTAKRQPIGFYICTGSSPLLDDQNPVKALGIIELFSVVLHIITILPIQLFKQHRQVGPETRGSFLKRLFLTEVETQTLLSITANVVIFLFMCLTAFNVAVLNKLEPSSLNSYPYDHLYYFAFFISPLMFTSLSVLLYFLSNKALRKAAKYFIVEICFKISKFFRCYWNSNLSEVTTTEVFAITRPNNLDGPI